MKRLFLELPEKSAHDSTSAVGLNDLGLQPVILPQI